MSVRDLLVGENDKTIEGLRSSSLPSEPDISFTEQLGIAIDKPSVTGGALYRFAADKLDGSKKHSVEELNMMFPDAPSGTFEVPNTKRMAEWLYKRAMNDDLFSNVNKYRSLEHGSVYNAISNVGYGIVQETSPTDIAIGIASGFGVTAMAGAASSALSKGVGSNLLLKGISALGQETTKAVIASELVEGLISLPVDYALRKGLEPYTQEKESFTNALMGTIGGAAASSALRVGAKQIGRLLNSRIEKRMDATVREAFGNGLEEELNSLTDAGVNWAQREAFTDIHKLRDLSVDDRLRYKVYSAAEFIDSGEEGMYALYNKNSSMSHNGAANPFGVSTHVASSASDLIAFSSAVKQKGQVVKLNPDEFKLLDIDLMDDASPAAAAIKSVLKEHGIEYKTAKDGIDIVRKLEDGDLIESEIQEALKKLDYEGIKITEISDLVDKKFNKKNIFIFDGIDTKSKELIKELDGSLAGLPESTMMFNATKRTSLEFGEGILTNGKKIQLDPNGYFNTDPFYGNPVKTLAYTEYLGVDQVNEINRLVSESKLDALKTKYTTMNDSLIEHVKQLKLMSEFEEAEAILKGVDPDTIKQNKEIIAQYEQIVEKMKQNNPEIADEIIKAADFCLRKYTK